MSLKLRICSNHSGGYAVPTPTSWTQASTISWAWEPCLHLVTCIMNETECLLACLRALLTFSRIKLIYLSRHLEVQHVTAEKQSPSALDYFAAISAALGLERRMAKAGQSKALKDLLTTVVGNYNKMCSTKSHRINSSTKAMLYNLFLVALDSFVTLGFLILCLSLELFAGSFQGFVLQRNWVTCFTCIMIATNTNCQAGIPCTVLKSSPVLYLSPIHSISLQGCRWSFLRRIGGRQGWTAVPNAPNLLASHNGERSSIPVEPRCCCGPPDWPRTMLLVDDCLILSCSCLEKVLCLEGFWTACDDRFHQKAKGGMGMYTVYMSVSVLCIHSMSRKHACVFPCAEKPAAQRGGRHYVAWCGVPLALGQGENENGICRWNYWTACWKVLKGDPWRWNSWLQPSGVWWVGCSQVGCDGLAAANTHVIDSPEIPSQNSNRSWLRPNWIISMFGVSSLDFDGFLQKPVTISKPWHESIKPTNWISKIQYDWMLQCPGFPQGFLQEHVIYHHVGCICQLWLDLPDFFGFWFFPPFHDIYDIQQIKSKKWSIIYFNVKYIKIY